MLTHVTNIPRTACSRKFTQRSHLSGNLGIPQTQCKLGEPCPKEAKPGPCAGYGLLQKYTKLRNDSATVPILPYIHKSIEVDFQAALNEINQVVPGGIGFTEVYRTFEYQKSLFEATQVKGYRGNPAAPPGTSRHEGGFAFDVKGMGKVKEPTTLAKTIIPLFAKYGFEWGGSFNDAPHFQAKYTKGGYKDSTEAATAARNYYDNCIKGGQ